RVTCQSTDGHGTVRRPVACCSDCRHRLSGESGHDSKPVHIGQLALIGRHAERGVTLEMLDGAEALTLGKNDVVNGDIVLEIHESLAVAQMPEWSDGKGLVIHVSMRD